MSSAQILIHCTSEFSNGQMMAGYIRFYAEEQLRVQLVNGQVHHTHPLAIQVMKEDGIDISADEFLSADEARTIAADLVLEVMTMGQHSYRALEQVHATETKTLSFPSPMNSTAYDQVLEDFRSLREDIKKAAIGLVGEFLYQDRSMDRSS